ncbi:MAG: hypothetical protein K0R73_1260 [Candidatus Midichloriaceae bacterium]|jgi:hypothetical protein|nr:hypothetical protein [Candidatus Midichloriaceae bacterium]
MKHNIELVAQHTKEIANILARYDLTKAVFCFDEFFVNIYCELKEYSKQNSLSKDITKMFFNRYNEVFPLKEVAPTHISGQKLTLPKGEKLVVKVKPWISPSVIKQCNTGPTNEMRVITKKLAIFLQEYLNITTERISKSPNLVYGLTASYWYTLMVFAYRQYFNLPYKVIANHLDTYCDYQMMQDLNQTGLATVTEKEDEYYINFDQDIEQEFFAALFLLKGMLYRSGENLEEIKCTMQEARFKPKYRPVFTTLAKLSLTGNPLIQGWDGANTNQVLSYGRSCLPKVATY